jgi:arylsulfatase A-like enzyme
MNQVKNISVAYRLLLGSLMLVLPLGMMSVVEKNVPGRRNADPHRRTGIPAIPPNIILIMADDMGYSDIGCFGSEIQTPNLDRMARNGLRMTQFYNASRCCPTRASLLTGLYPHQAGVGDMVGDRGQAAYQGYLNQQCVTIAEALRPAGYRTYMAGKWHVGTTPDHWPVKRGFDRYFGLIDGASSYFNNHPYRPNQTLTTALDDQPITPGPDYYATNAYADYALKFIDGNPKDNPFFLYLAFTAPHWPLHALPQDVVKYRGKHAGGWDQIRAARFSRMKKLGILDPTTTLSPRDSTIPAWNTLNETEKARWSDDMATYAAMIDRMDQNIGRILARLRERGDDRNTIILFLSDNGASHETTNGNGFLPSIVERSKLPASDTASFTAYGRRGANVSNTPFRLYKHWEYEGGTATSFIAYGPSVVKPGRVSHQPGHIIDLMSTCLDLAGATYPRTYNGHTITPTEGISLVPLLKGQSRLGQSRLSPAWTGHDALYFEHEGNRAVRQGDWKLVSTYPADSWALYNLKTDRTELHDRSQQQPQRVRQMAALYDAWAKRVGVIPYAKLTKLAEN